MKREKLKSVDDLEISPDRLVEAAKILGLNLPQFKWYLRLHRYGNKAIKHIITFWKD
jgi:hypothetical protein